jgi:NDP-sugar pyrophosphorylase family protein
MFGYGWAASGVLSARAVILDAGQPETCYPLTCTRSLADCIVANRRLLEVQRERLTEGGFQLVDGQA